MDKYIGASTIITVLGVQVEVAVQATTEAALGEAIGRINLTSDEYQTGTSK